MEEALGVSSSFRTFSFISHSRSAITMRPSASVLPTLTLRPARETTSSSAT